MATKNLLFLCTGNSCRSQMAEGIARAVAPAGIAVFSAGTHPKGVHPRAVDAMAEIGIDIRGQTSKDLAAIPLERIDTVVTLCGDADEACPSFPRPVLRIHWGLNDPALAVGSEEAVAAVFRAVRDDLRSRVSALFAVERGETEVSVISRDRVYDGGKVVKIDIERLELPNGQVADLEILRHPGASAVVPIHSDGTVVLIRQYRHAAGGYILEVPAGRLEPNETPEACARREIAEEAGLFSESLHRLGAILTTPGFTDEVIHLYAATSLRPIPRRLERDEIIDVITFPFDRALELIASSEIRDGKTICAIFRAQQELRSGRLRL